MPKTISSIIIAALIVLGGTTGLLFFAHNEPSTQSLDDDLRLVRNQIVEAENSSARYQAGLIKIFIDLRCEVLRTTEAMLQQKRNSLIRRIDLRYTVSGRQAEQSPERLRKIENDIREAKTKLEKDEIDALGKSGLIQGLALMTIETERLALAHLYVAYFDEKYGIQLPPIKPEQGGVSPKAIIPGPVVKDKDAL